MVLVMLMERSIGCSTLRSMSVLPRGINEIFAAVGEQMLLVGADLDTGVDLAGVDVHAVLALLGEGDGQGHDVTGDFMRHVFGQLLLIHPVFVQRRHEVRERPRHLELDLQSLRREDEGVLVRVLQVLHRCTSIIVVWSIASTRSGQSSAKLPICCHVIMAD